MKEDLAKLTGKIKPLVNKLLNYKLFIFFIVILLLYSFLVLRINSLSSQVPDDTEVVKKLQQSAPNLDDSVKKKIHQLQDNSAEVRSLFNEARKNPFHE